MSVIEFADVTKRFNNRAVLERVNMVFDHGHVYFLSGESGSGKTTFLHLMARYLEPEQGMIHIQQGLKMAYLLQEDALFSNLTVMDNITIKYLADGTHSIPTDPLLHRALETFHVGHLAESKVSTLSGGERRRVQLAVSLCAKPDIMLLDEPTSGLDQANRELIMHALWEVLGDRVVIVVSHDDLSFTDAIKLQMIDGRVERA